MRSCSPFLADDLAELDDALLARADAVVSMRDVHAGQTDPLVIGLRHDVDNVFWPAVDLAVWEADRGYTSTYFILHDSPYWNDGDLRLGLETIASLGHEIGIHTNAITVALKTGRDPHAILEEAIERLRSWGHAITGVVGHGDPLCYTARFVNDELFAECARPEMGEPDRTLAHHDVRLQLQPRSLADFGLEYESYRSGARALYLSDSGGRWSTDFDDLCAAFPAAGQLHILMHPDWWTEAFPIAAPTTVAA